MSLSGRYFLLRRLCGITSIRSTVAGAVGAHPRVTGENNMADKPATIAAAVLISVIGGFPIFTLPIIGPVLQEQLGFTIQQATGVGFSEVLGVGLASILAMFWIRRINWRVAALIAVTAVVIGNILTTFQSDPTVPPTRRRRIAISDSSPRLRWHLA